MNRPLHAELARARQLLAIERSASEIQGLDGQATENDWAAAAAQVLEKLFVHLSPLIGELGVEALLLRSVRITKSKAGAFEVSAVANADSLRTFLRLHNPEAAGEMATELFGVFFTLVTTYIGERLTTQVLRSAWPTIENLVDRETIK